MWFQCTIKECAIAMYLLSWFYLIMESTDTSHNKTNWRFKIKTQISIIKTHNKKISMSNLSLSNPGTSPETKAIKAMRYIWSAIDSAPFIPWLTHPFLFVVYKAYIYDKDYIIIHLCCRTSLHPQFLNSYRIIIFFVYQIQIT